MLVVYPTTHTQLPHLAQSFLILELCGFTVSSDGLRAEMDATEAADSEMLRSEAADWMGRMGWLHLRLVQLCRMLRPRPFFAPGRGPALPGLTQPKPYP